MDKNFFNRNAEVVAQELLGKIILVNNKKAKIVETEAYFDERDPASRACQNGDLRETMLMQGGTILVYGVHNNWLVNFVTGLEGDAQAVLIRAAEPLNFSEKCSGPGLLTKKLGIDKEFHKTKIEDKISIMEGDKNFEIVSSFRIGVRKDLDRPLRFYIKGNRCVSRS